VRVLTPKWDTASRVSPQDAVVTGEGSEGERAGAVQAADKPLFIYVTDGSGGDGGFDKIEKVILDDNKVLVGMRAFRCVRMTTDDVANDPLLSGKSKDDRYFMFVSRDYDKVKVIDGSKLKTKSVYSAMKKFARREYKTNFDKAVKATLKLLIDYDKINSRKRLLEQKREREGSEISKRDAEEIEEELKELAEEQKAAEEKQEKILTWELKS
jgi:hypothetical protein